VTVAETLLVYVAIPLGVFLLLAALVFLPGGRKRPRWKSGQPWEHAPVWYEPHPEATGGAHGGGHDDGSADRHAAIGAGRGATALTAGPNAEADSAATAAAGPLGGARGTW
jgi:hypothetical protein